ncbi:bifunctional tetrahydrofolate synthase/dihydrofolate synthase [Oceanicoccus sp. KOV_DT_Chl]|uniref:bifunctional tetrahydrofolate synthase/dihydrofolate synthase n=1 Tax=Oceanicoccus sp. KOV_DT_Chl TaxID=1904639 RepID=UPI000C79DD5C|nr:bifunctional tetrahydrofolate synthase/dihydrofolate synthase [Oceanicoccus sp. KOV_DT_Chl]
MRFNLLQDWLSWLESCHPSEIELGLTRVGTVASTMGLDLSECKVVTVAGTNGKGSCVASLNTLLRSAGYRVGCFTSPHFLEYNERIVVNDKRATDQQISAAFDAIDQARADISLTYFEFGTLAAFYIFQQSELDVVILEVGLGGRLDAVNIIDADIAVVTSIDIDHEEWLGNDREVIGREKAGIFRAGRYAISAGYSPPQSLQQAAAECGAILLQAGDDFTFNADKGCWSGQNLSSQPIQLTALPAVQLPTESVSAAIQALHLLDLPIASVDYQVLAATALTGRFQQLRIAGKHVIMDVAHNPAAATHLAHQLLVNVCQGRTFALFAVMADKDIPGIICAIEPQIDSWYLADLPHTSRAMSASLLANEVVKHSSSQVSVCHNIQQALQQVLSLMTGQDRLVVFGSFFTVADVLAFNQQPSTIL